MKVVEENDEKIFTKKEKAGMIRAILFIFFYPGVSSQIFQTVKRNSVWKGVFLFERNF